MLSFSCNNEPIGGIEEFEEQIITDTTFMDTEGNEYYTGGSCSSGSPHYNSSGDVLEGLEIPLELPEEFSLSNLLPPIGNQGSQGSCVSWAVGYYMKSLQEKIQNELDNLDSPTVMSPAYTYNQITQGNCSGTSVVTTLELLKQKGIVPMDIFPYTSSNCSTQPSLEQDEIALDYRISEYKSLSGLNMVNEMKTLITQQTPIVISTTLSTEFGKKDTFNLTAYRDHIVNYSNSGCHAMLVVGYSDTYNAFKVVNSWGSGWGDNGYVWIDYLAFENVLSESAPFRVINAAYVAYDF